MSVLFSGKPQEGVEARASVCAGSEIIQSPAKINLFLEVLGQRENGYHEIRSVVVMVSLFDTLIIERASKGIELEVEHEGLDPEMSLEPGLGVRNLIVRAAEKLKESTGFTGGARIKLVKRIPVGGGLGGGSSNAAATLTALNRLWGTNVSKEGLVGMGATLGSDVPAFMHGGTVRLEGTGETVTPLRSGKPEDSNMWAIVANPGFPVRTGDIYSRCSSFLTSLEGGCKKMCFALERWDLGAVAGGLFNGLQETVLRKYPAIAMIMEGLESSGAMGVLVSGSGSSVFGLAVGQKEAEAIRDELNRRLGFRIWTRIAMVMPDGVMVAHGPLEA